MDATQHNASRGVVFHAADNEVNLPGLVGARVKGKDDVATRGDGDGPGRGDQIRGLYSQVSS